MLSPALAAIFASRLVYSLLAGAIFALLSEMLDRIDRSALLPAHRLTYRPEKLRLPKKAVIRVRILATGQHRRHAQSKQ